MSQAVGSKVRGIAAMAVHEVVYGGRSATATLAARAGSLAAADRSLLTELTLGTLRWHHRNRAVINAALDKPLRKRDRVLESLISVGVYQLEETRLPAYAVVSATVAAAQTVGHPRARGLVNAVLRRYQREKDRLLAVAMNSESARYAHPQWFIDAVRADWPDKWQSILAANNERPTMWLRVNRLKSTPEQWLRDNSDRLGEGATVLAGFDFAVGLSSSRGVEEIPGFPDGEVSVQNPASQLAATLLRPGEGMRVLDACAAPGGKTGHLLEYAPAADVVALDISNDRLARVTENLSRLGLSATTCCADLTDTAAWWDGRPFDRILLDAPCSGTGVIGRHPDIKFLRRAEDIPAFQLRQREMLAAAWRVLAPGGNLLYATCSIFKAENDAVVGDFVANQADSCWLEARNGTPLTVTGEGIANGISLIPGDSPTDGFYYALIGRRP